MGEVVEQNGQQFIVVKDKRHGKSHQLIVPIGLDNAISAAHTMETTS